jgi:hypothetical protein
LAQRIVYEMRGSMWRDDRLVAEDQHTLQLTMYFTYELRAMIEAAGFVDVELRGDYTDAEPTADSAFVVFIGRKPR